MKKKLNFNISIPMLNKKKKKILFTFIKCTVFEMLRLKGPKLQTRSMYFFLYVQISHSLILYSVASFRIILKSILFISCWLIIGLIQMNFCKKQVLFSTSLMFLETYSQELHFLLIYINLQWSFFNIYFCLHYSTTWSCCIIHEKRRYLQ